MESQLITISATYKDIRLPTQYLRALLIANHVAKDVIDGCELALHELLANLVDHAYNGEGGLITVHLACDHAQILIETRDSGAPARVDLHSVAMPEPSAMAEGGYGVAIMQSIMDAVEYGRENDENIWKLTKHID